MLAFNYAKAFGRIRAFPSNYKDHPSGLRPYGQPGPLPIGGLHRLID